MNAIETHWRKKRWLIGSLFLLTLLPVEADTVTLILTNRQEMDVDLVGVAGQSLQWRLDESDPTTQAMPLSRIESIRFPLTSAWLEADGAFRYGRLQEAVNRYKAIANQKREHYYPIPGNLASLAQMEILECYRRMLDADLVAQQAAVIQREAKTLPPSRRTVPLLTRCWIAVGRKDWEDALKIAESETGDGGIELAYLKGRALDALGRSEEALDAYTETYTLSFGSQPELSRDALRKSSEILAALNDENRQAELQAQLKIYQELFGAGKLWEGASEDLVALAETELQTLGGGRIEIPALPDLPPQEGRDWLLALEIDPTVYVIGAGPFLSNESVVPSKRGNNLVFSGSERMWRYSLNAKGQGIRIRAIFIPESDHGVILCLGDKEGGFILYLSNGQVMLAWCDQPGRVTQMPLGSVKVGTQTTVVLTVRDSKEVLGRVSPEPGKTFGKVPNLIQTERPLAAFLASTVKPENAIVPDLPNFEGIIRHLSLAVTKELSKVGQQEAQMFGGKPIHLGVPSQ